MEKTLTAESTPSLSTNELFFGSSPKKRLNQWLATAVISSKTAVEYLHTVYPAFGVIESTICVLGFFAVLAIVGITEPAVVALTIFLFHMVTLTLGHHRLLLIKIYSSFSEILL